MSVAIPPTPTQPADLVLGGIVFLTEEVIGKVPFPTTDQLVTHKLPGGYKNVQDMGTQPEPIVWSGTFWDAQAAVKKQAIRDLQKQGQPVTLEWADEKYSVYIAKFDPTVIYAGRIDYEITCEVVADLAGASTTSIAASIDSQTSALYSSAQALYARIQAIQSVQAPPVPSGLGSSLSLLGVALQNAGPLAQASISQIAAIGTQVGAINGTMGSYAVALNASIATFAGAGIPSSLQQLSVASLQLTNVVALIGANAQVGQAPKIITVGGGSSLFALAAQYYGDATLAPVIQAANGLPSMKLPPGGSYTLKLPPALSGGLT